MFAVPALFCYSKIIGCGESFLMPLCLMTLSLFTVRMMTRDVHHSPFVTDVYEPVMVVDECELVSDLWFQIQFLIH